MAKPLIHETTMQIRMSFELREKLHNRARQLNKTDSDYIRDLVTQDCENIIELKTSEELLNTFMGL